MMMMMMMMAMMALKFSILVLFTMIVVMSSYSGMIVTDVSFKSFVCLIMGKG